MCLPVGSFLFSISNAAFRRTQSLLNRSYRCFLSSTTTSTEKSVNKSVGKTDNLLGKRAKIVVSGVQPTGVPHVGNYFGFIEPWLAYQRDECGDTVLLLSIADWHSITAKPQKPDDLRQNVLRMTAALLASGIDPQRTILFRQSGVGEHLELAWLLSCLTSESRLHRLPQYRQKTAQGARVSIGLLSYPILQAADVMLYRATHVPVGDDQTPHISLMFNLIRTFTNFYKSDYFPVPSQVTSSHARLKSLRDPGKKMSKSDLESRSRIDLNDSDQLIRAKCRRALSDCTRSLSYDPLQRPAISNLIDIYSALVNSTPREVLEEKGDVENGPFKLLLAEKLIERFGPIRDRYEQLIESREYLDDILRSGEERAKRMAVANMREIRRITGFR